MHYIRGSIAITMFTKGINSINNVTVLVIVVLVISTYIGGGSC